MNNQFERTHNLSVIFEVMTEGVVIQNENGSIIEFNNSALSILGLTSDQLLGRTAYDPNWKTVNENLTKADPSLNPSTLARLTGEIQKNRIMGVQKPNGDLVWISITAVPIKNKSRPPFSAVITFHEITEIIQLKREVELHKSELKLVMNSLPVLIGHWDKNLINLHSNEAYSYYFGKTPDQIKGLHIKEVLGEKIFGLNYPYMQKALQGEFQEFEREIPVPTGGSKSTIANYIPEFQGSEVIGFFVIVTDITQLKNLEQERRQMELMVFNSARMSWLGEMAAGMAHEINNPLAIVLGYLNILKLELKQGSYGNAITTLDKSEDALKRISTIVKELNYLAKDGNKEKVQSIRLSSIFESVLNLSSEGLKKKGINLIVPPFSDSTINCGKASIVQVLINILNNSVDAVSFLKDRWIKISIEQDQDFVFIKIIDSGKGIDGLADKIMDPFFTTKIPGKGTGLGLSISKEIMRNQNGDLYYVPNQENTTFTIKIPIV